MDLYVDLYIHGDYIFIIVDALSSEISTSFLSLLNNISQTPDEIHSSSLLESTVTSRSDQQKQGNK